MTVKGLFAAFTDEEEITIIAASRLERFAADSCSCFVELCHGNSS